MTAGGGYGTGTVGGHATGGGGSGTWTSGDWVYLGAADTTVHFYEPPAESSPEDQAVRVWLWAERDWKDGERLRQCEAAAAKARELLLSLLPEPEKERYRLQGYFEVIGSHGGHYQVRRGVSGNIDWLHPDGKVSAVTRAAVGPALRRDRPAIDSAHVFMPDIYGRHPRMTSIGQGTNHELPQSNTNPPDLPHRPGRSAAAGPGTGGDGLKEASWPP
jgi:hypothetical protein